MLMPLFWGPLWDLLTFLSTQGWFSLSCNLGINGLISFLLLPFFFSSFLLLLSLIDSFLGKFVGGKIFHSRNCTTVETVDYSGNLLPCKPCPLFCQPKLQNWLTTHTDANILYMWILTTSRIRIGTGNPHFFHYEELLNTGINWHCNLDVPKLSDFH